MGNLWVGAARQMDSVENLLSYQPTDGDTWDEVRENSDWSHPKLQAMVDDVRRHGVREPVMVDYENNPPTVEDGHTRVLAAHKAGVTHVPVRQGSRLDFYMENPD